MKHYKLLKDLPFAKPGEIFERRTFKSKDGLSDYDYFEICKLKHGEVNKTAFGIKRNEFIDNLNEWFEEIDSFVVPDEFEMGFWTIMYGEEGFYTWYLPADEFEEDYEEKLKQHMELGWAFETKTEAEDFLEWSKARAVIKQDTKGFKPNWYNHHQSKWSVEYDYDDSSLGVWHETFNKTAEFYFETYEDAENSINNHRTEWMTYLGVKE